MKVHQSAIAVETFSSLNGDSINHGFFVGDADTPVQDDTSFEQMIDEYFEMYTIPGKGRDVIPMDSLSEVVDQLNALVKAAEYFKARLQKAKAFDRQAWLEANENTFNHNNFDDFLKDIEL